MQQMMLHVDRRLETLLAQLSKAVGENGFTLVLAGAHGAPPEPSEDSRQRMVVNGETVAQEVDGAWCPPASAAWKGICIRFCISMPGAAAIPSRSAAWPRAPRCSIPRCRASTRRAAHAPHQDSWLQRFRNSFHPAAVGGRDAVLPSGVCRGLPTGPRRLLRLSVQLRRARAAVFLRAAIQAGSVRDHGGIGGCGATLARTLGVPPPSSATGRVLGEALAE